MNLNSLRNPEGHRPFHLINANGFKKHGGGRGIVKVYHISFLECPINTVAWSHAGFGELGFRSVCIY